jgi:hypothetical protein
MARSPSRPQRSHRVDPFDHLAASDFVDLRVVVAEEQSDET